jgi:hypothetical protein
MSWWEESDNKDSSKEELTWVQQTCLHNWKSTTLIISVVYDCVKCGVKKEDYEEWEKNRFSF